MEQALLEEIKTQLQELKKLVEWSLALSFMAAISRASMDTYTQVGQFWEESPVFLNVLNVAKERAIASTVQAESRRQKSEVLGSESNIPMDRQRSSAG